MRSTRRMLSLLLAVFLLAALLAGCKKSEEDPELRTLSVSVCGPLETLDPAMNTGAGAESVLSALFEGLMRMRDDGSGGAAAAAGVAKEYLEEKNYDDTVTYTFTLRSAARWSDGRRVSAEDFVYAWQRLVDPATDSPNAELLRMVSGYDEVRKTGDVSALGVRADGDSTFIVTLSEPCAYFIRSVCTAPAAAPLRRDLVESGEDWASTAAIVTNGAFRVETWVKSARLQLARNEEYYESRLIVPDMLCFRLDLDEQTGYDALLAGELDYVSSLPYAAAEALAEDESRQPQPLARTQCVLYNHLTDAFSDAQVRRAFELALDRASISSWAGAAASAATGCVPEGVSGVTGEESFRTAGGTLCAVDEEGFAERSTEAARLLAAAGHYQGAGLDGLRLLFVDGEAERATAAALRGMWKNALGVEVELVDVPSDEFSERLSSGDFDLALTTFSARCDDAMEFLLPFCGTSADNVSGYRNDTFDLLIGVAASTGDENARAAFLHDAESMLLDDCAVSPLTFSRSSALLRDGLRGLGQDCLGRSYFFNVSEAG